MQHSSDPEYVVASDASARGAEKRADTAATERRAVARRLENLHPAYFALVMSTGIVSIACAMLGYPGIASALLWLNVPAYLSLVGLTLARVVLFPRAFLADWGDHQRGVGFFTSVAATCVVGTQHALLRGDLALGMHIWWVGLVLWCICMYAIFTALTVSESKPTLPNGINGGWLVAVVATQSLCVLGCTISPAFGPNREAALFVMIAFWLCGGMLYIWTISLIFYRYTFFRFLPSDLMPPYWINMGAMAISTLAGTALIKNASTSPLLGSLLPFLRGFTLWYWATATWWIPMLLILAVWRHVVKRFPIAYDPLYWGAVFPLGMYTACTEQLANVMGISMLTVVPRRFVFIALAAWTFAFLGLLRRLYQVGLEGLGDCRAARAHSAATLR